LWAFLSDASSAALGYYREGLNGGCQHVAQPLQTFSFSTAIMYTVYSKIIWYRWNNFEVSQHWQLQNMRESRQVQALPGQARACINGALS